jgi:hypothetical protein
VFNIIKNLLLDCKRTSLVCSNCLGDIKDSSDGEVKRRIILPDILLKLKLVDQEGYLLNGPSSIQRLKCAVKSQHLLDIVNRSQADDNYLFCSSDENGVFITEDCISLVNNVFEHLEIQPSTQENHLIPALNIIFHPSRVIKILCKFNYKII